VAPCVGSGVFAHASVRDWLWSILHVQNPPVIIRSFPGSA
jgi:hypothetical protein